MSEASPPERPERALARVAARYIESRGYRAFIDPDGHDYFDLAALRGREVGLIELKAGSPGPVLHQALLRRAWAEWGCMAVGSRRGAEGIVARTREGPGRFLGVWWIHRGEIQVLREHEPWPELPGEDPLALPRRLLRVRLERLSEYRVPEGIRWAGLPGWRSKASGGRGFREWRLEEFGSQESPSPTRDESTRD
jgi:hypothetical protein